MFSFCCCSLDSGSITITSRFWGVKSYYNTKAKKLEWANLGKSFLFKGGSLSAVDIPVELIRKRSPNYFFFKSSRMEYFNFYILKVNYFTNKHITLLITVFCMWHLQNFCLITVLEAFWRKFNFSWCFKLLVHDSLFVRALHSTYSLKSRIVLLGGEAGADVFWGWESFFIFIMLIN